MAQDDLTTRLAKFFSWAMRDGPFEGCDLDGASIQAKGVELGLLVETTYDPAIHGMSNCDASPGDPWMVMAPEVGVLVSD